VFLTSEHRAIYPQLAWIGRLGLLFRICLCQSNVISLGLVGSVSKPTYVQPASRAAADVSWFLPKEQAAGSFGSRLSRYVGLLYISRSRLGTTRRFHRISSLFCTVLQADHQYRRLTQSSATTQARFVVRRTACRPGFLRRAAAGSSLERGATTDRFSGPATRLQAVQRVASACKQVL